MQTIIARLYKVTCQFDWQKGDETSTWHCGTLKGARRFVESQKDRGLLWYSIEGQDFIPCDENEPGGQLYIAMIHHEFKEIQKGAMS